MSQTIVITGPPGSGKSTVSSLLQQRLAGSVRIDGDALRSFAPADARRFLGPGSTYRAAGALARFYGDAGASWMIVDYIFRTMEDIDRLALGLGDRPRPMVFVLWSDFPTLESRIRQRGRETDLERARKTWQLMQDEIGSLGTIVHTSESAEHIAALIEVSVRSR